LLSSHAASARFQHFLPKKRANAQIYASFEAGNQLSPAVSKDRLCVPHTAEESEFRP
jgi:hypothetical protein